MPSRNELLEAVSQYLENVYQANSGISGFDRISNSSTLTNDKVYFAIKAVNGDVTLGANTTTITGDAPSAGDVILQGDVLYGLFDDIEVTSATSGDAYAYIKAD